MRNLVNKLNKSNKIKIYTGIILTLLVITGIVILAIIINNWYNSHTIIYQTPVEVSFQQPVVIEIRKPQVIKKTIVYEYPDEIDTPIEKYICEKFGQYDCRVALAIVQAESGFNDQAMGVNTNGSVDLGLWQINFPTRKGTISPKDALDPYKATDWAYAKYKRDGNFNAWVAFTTNRYLANY